MYVQTLTHDLKLFMKSDINVKSQKNSFSKILIQALNSEKDPYFKIKAQSS